MAPAGIQVEFGVGITNKFALLSSEFDEGSSKRKNKQTNKPKTNETKEQVNNKKIQQNTQQQVTKTQQQTNTSVPFNKTEVPIVPVKTEEQEKKSYVKQTFEKKNKTFEKNLAKPEETTKGEFNKEKKLNNNFENRIPKQNNIKVQTIVVETTKPLNNEQNVVTNNTISEDFHKENTRRNHFNRKQERLDKGNQTFDERGKRVYDRHSGQVKSSVKGSNIKKFNASDEYSNPQDENAPHSSNIDENNRNQSNDANKKKAFDNSNEEDSKEISYAEYKKNLALQGNEDITKMYSNNLLPKDNNNKNNEPKTNEKNKNNNNKAKKETIEIEIDSSVKNNESNYIRSNRPNNRNYNNKPLSNFKPKTTNDKNPQRFQRKDKKVDQPKTVTPSINLVDDFPSL